MYALTVNSRKPEAKAFRKWVTSAVLPAIRKDGAYVMGEEKVQSPEELAVLLEAARLSQGRCPPASCPACAVLGPTS